MNLSIIIPTYNEQENVRLITERIISALKGQVSQYEIIFVDDSRDGTQEVLERLVSKYSQVRYIHRYNEKGLASAVVKGFHCSQGKHIIVMDADLQHPPELIPLILKRLSEADVVLPSRFIEGGSDGGLSSIRKLVSWTARTIGRVSIHRLRDISDCTSGYFGLNRSVIEGVCLDPIGWKILMEVLVKGKYQTVHEIPYQFVIRDLGASKMNTMEQWNYIRHVIKLVTHSPEDLRFFFFCIVGTLGVLVNLMSLNILLNSGICSSELMASVGASLIAMAHNFLWNDNVTWKGHKHPVLWRRILQLPQFILICGFGIAITALFARVFMYFQWNIYIGQFIGIFISTYWSFAANNRWTWSANQQPEEKRTRLVVTQE